MKVRTPTRYEKRIHDRMASEIGCIACRKDGIRNMHVSIHHIDGRTKPGAHLRVLPLCSGHHQDGTGAPGLIAVHPWKRRFEEKYGTQLELLEECMEILAERNCA
ncbi:Ref family recombination enhancement nuclease [Pseudomonas paraeruginosa]|uniref:Ref family recombination enhancement nuclease n=1 Tax=Pseudomonas paraeruginosa TaxID=2994495 RepID=UPI0039FC988A